MTYVVYFYGQKYVPNKKGLRTTTNLKKKNRGGTPPLILDQRWNSQSFLENKKNLIIMTLLVFKQWFFALFRRTSNPLNKILHYKDYDIYTLRPFLVLYKIRIALSNFFICVPLSLLITKNLKIKSFLGYFQRKIQNSRWSP